MSLVGGFICVSCRPVLAHWAVFLFKYSLTQHDLSDNVYFDALGVIYLHLMIWIERARR